VSQRRQLIDRKQQVIAEAAGLRREVERLRDRDNDRPTRRLIARLERRIEYLAGEEQRLRMEIDRTAR
jgi:hypothetical protein